LALVIPIGLQWMQPILVNINMTLFCNSLVFCTLCLTLAKLAQSRASEDRSEVNNSLANTSCQIVAACCGITAFLHLFNSNVAFTFIKHAQPYCLSTVCLAWLFYTYISEGPISWQQKSNNALKSSLRYLPFVYLSIIINPISILLALSFSTSLAIIGIKKRSRACRKGSLFWAIISCIAYLLYEVTVRLYRQHYGISATSTTFSAAGFYTGFAGALKEVIININGFEV